MLNQFFEQVRSFAVQLNFENNSPCFIAECKDYTKTVAWQNVESNQDCIMVFDFNTNEVRTLNNCTFRSHFVDTQEKIERFGGTMEFLR